jgi:hypothetical protein
MPESTPSGFTKFPRWLYALLPQLTNATLRVCLIVLHESVGWGYASVVLSHADFVQRSGLSKSSVLEGIQTALDLNILQRMPHGQGFAYRLKPPSDQSAFPTTVSRNVTVIGQIRRLTANTFSQKSLLLPVQNSDSPPSPKQTRGSPKSRLPPVQNSDRRVSVTASNQRQNRVPIERNQETMPEAQLGNTHTGPAATTPRVRATPTGPPPGSAYSYEAVLEYTSSLTGIRSPGGLAVVYWRSGEMDAEIAKFQVRQAERAGQQAEAAARHEAEMMALVAEIQQRGAPFAVWEQDLLAAYGSPGGSTEESSVPRAD